MYCSKQLVVAGVLLVVAVAAVGGSVQPPTGGPAESPQETTIRFEDVSEEVGPAYEAKIDGAGVSNTISNAGVYAADVDRDGWTDLLAVGGERPVLFENDRGEFRRTEAVPRLDRSVRSALFVDYDTDGWEDLLLVSEDREPLLLENDGGTFDRVDAGFDREFAVPIGATAADYDRDGCLDFFVVQNGRWSERPPLGMNDVSVPLDDDNGKPNALFEGTCSGFERAEDGDIAGTRWSLATSFVDLTGDGWADIHVANDFNRDVLYVNQRNGSFERVVLSNRTDRNGMSSEIADVTGDGRPDVFTTNIFHAPVVREVVPEGQKARAHGNTLLVNRDNASFVDRAGEFNVREGGWGWAAEMEDFDNDGDADLFHTTQRIDFDRRTTFTSLDQEDVEYIEFRYPSYRYPLIAERNESGFDRRSAAVVGFAGTDGRGVATLDFDRDGRLDIALANADGEFKLYRNTCETATSLQVTLEGDGETLAVGASVSVTTGDETETKRYSSNTDFLSQSARTLHFGTGTRDSVEVRVEWPDGTTQTFSDVPTGYRILVTPDERIVAEEEHDR